MDMPEISSMFSITLLSSVSPIKPASILTTGTASPVIYLSVRNPSITTTSYTVVLMIVRFNPAEVIFLPFLREASIPVIKSTTVSTITVIRVAFMGKNTKAIEIINDPDFDINGNPPSTWLGGNPQLIR